VGNISAGGTGKTPVTLALAEMLSSKSFKLSPAILSRGYRRKSKGFQIVSNGKATLCDWLTSGDEAQIYAKRLKKTVVAVDADRVQGGKNLISEFSPSVILLDDAFQHRRIDRDLDIVLIDSSRSYKNGHLLPAGIFREPVSSLSRADLILLTNFQLNDEQSEKWWEILTEIHGEKKLSACQLRTGICTSLRTGKRVSNESLRDKKIIGFCGIGNPGSFSHTLESLNAEIPYIIRFPDHHRYKPRDVEKLAMALNSASVDYLVTTEKDAVKLGGLFEALPILVLEVEVEWIRGTENLERELQDILQ
jgi:tetraacyldisaccharide 4'-kinase